VADRGADRGGGCGGVGNAILSPQAGLLPLLFGGWCVVCACAAIAIWMNPARGRHVGRAYIGLACVTLLGAAVQIAIRTGLLTR
jgi:hypothetical protein